MLGRPAHHLHAFLENCITESGCNTFQEIQLKGDRDEEIQEFTTVKSHIIECVIQYLSSRFTSLGSNAVLRACRMFDHRIWPQDRQEFATYGEDDLQTLATHFKDVLEEHSFNLASAQCEWTTMKVFISLISKCYSMMHYGKEC